MKKIIAVIMMMTVLMSTIGATAEVKDDMIAFCNRFEVEVVEEQDGSGTMYITVNDTLRHGILIYTENVESDSVECSVYRNCWSDDEELVGGTYTLNKDNYEYELEAIIYNLYMIEAAELDYAAGKVSEDYLNMMLFKYRMTVFG